MLILYIVTYGLLSLTSIIVKSVKKGEIDLNSAIFQILTKYSLLLKMTPAGLAALFVFLWSSSNPFYNLMFVGGLVFCLLGDFGMEKNFLFGLGLFLVAQIIFGYVFLGEALTLGIPSGALIPTGIIILVLLIFFIFYLFYLHSTPQSLGNLLVPVILYSAGISFMLVSAVVFWFTLNDVVVGFVVLGALSFVFSDSLIGINQFHHKISWREVKVMSSYYLALFLLSLSVVFV